MFTKLGWRKSETGHKQRVDEVITQLAVGRCRARSHAQSRRALSPCTLSALTAKNRLQTPDASHVTGESCQR